MADAAGRRRQNAEGGSRIVEIGQIMIPEGQSTQQLGTWVLGNSNYSTGFG